MAVPLRARNHFRWKKEELENSIGPKTRAILFNSPQNPTGVVHTEEDLKMIADIAIKHNLYILSDEVYERILWGGRIHQNICTLPA